MLAIGIEHGTSASKTRMRTSSATSQFCLVSDMKPIYIKLKIILRPNGLSKNYFFCEASS
jgi:hypothetical protein